MHTIPNGKIIKLGGAAITFKNEFETLNADVLRTASKHIWEGRSADPDACDTVVVHGAGSFGHFQAKSGGLVQGSATGSLGDPPGLRAGFCATRQSVTKLNHHVVSVLMAEGLPACALSPLAAGWQMEGGKVVEASLDAPQHDGAAPASSPPTTFQGHIGSVTSLLNAGLLPVLHGDSILDSKKGCSILSGDVIVRVLAQQLRPAYVLFLTNVAGVFDRPPEQEGARLLREIVVRSADDWWECDGNCHERGCGEVQEQEEEEAWMERRRKRPRPSAAGEDRTEPNTSPAPQGTGAGTVHVGSESRTEHAEDPRNPAVSNAVLLFAGGASWHDTTGGMKTKISEALAVATCGVPVYIAKQNCPGITPRFEHGSEAGALALMRSLHRCAAMRRAGKGTRAALATEPMASLGQRPGRCRT
eukprot:jgi/Mesvir1/7480/Mv19242-RA.1